MDLDKAKSRGLCFKCGMPGHIAKTCPNRQKEEVRQIISGMTEETHQIWLDQLGLSIGQSSRDASPSPQGFQQAQE